ncbi:MAG: general secretion pathway protein GspB, partial [Proteobacteria bacterium]|nr:general secretion pathway protein GspB [Pseudomonadota bacterium]
SYQIQTALPDLPILVHVYGEDASARFVVIRHKRYREGDPLGDNLTLEAITPSGAVLRYRDTSFRIDR